jgi:hypothetical protein
MGRGRAKAKQTKVARALKYYSGETDLERLARELAEANGEAPPAPAVDDDPDEDDDLNDPYASYLDDDEDDDEDEAEDRPGTKRP